MTTLIKGELKALRVHICRDFHLKREFWGMYSHRNIQGMPHLLPERHSEAFVAEVQRSSCVAYKSKP